MVEKILGITPKTLGTAISVAVAIGAVAVLVIGGV